MGDILTVRELTQKIRTGLEAKFPFVWVRGEVSNLARPGSGHLYFSLKDSEALLNCVWFKSAQRDNEGFDPLTGEVFADGPRPGFARSLRDGEQILCAGRISVYAQRGAYQLVVELAQADGSGQLTLAFEARKQKLAALGYFDQARKRPLPPRPVRVAVLTAPGGAAIRDFLRIADERGCGAQIRIYPVPVQGEAAATTIAATLRRVNSEDWAQLVVLIRGGGSLEDLWAFNEEVLAEAVFCSGLPVLAGIGHEIDISMVDLTADMRAATPSHAAQMLWPLRSELSQRVDELETLLLRAGQRIFEQTARRLHAFEQALGWFSPIKSLARKAEDGRLAQLALQRVMSRYMLERRARLERCQERLGSQPARLVREALARYTLLYARLGGTRLLAPRERALEHCELRLKNLGQSLLRGPENTLERLGLALQGLDPYAPLERGYALVHNAAGQLVRSSRQTRKGDILRLRLHSGSLEAQVVNLQEETK